MKHFLTTKIVYDGQKIISLFDSYKFISTFKNDIRFYDTYTVVGNERPEHIANKLYDSTAWWWLIVLFAFDEPIIDPFFNWILSQNEIEKWAEKLIIEEFGTMTGHETEYFAKIASLTNENENNREIKIIKSKYLGDIVKQFNQWEK